MRERLALALVATALLACASGCKKQVDRAGFISAINKSFAGRHECVWPEAIKLPAQADPAKDERVRDYEALTDAGLFIRESVEKKHSRRIQPGQQLQPVRQGTLRLDSRPQPARLRQLLLRTLQCHRHRQSRPERPLQPHAIYGQLQLRGRRCPRLGPHPRVDEDVSQDRCGYIHPVRYCHPGERLRRKLGGHDLLNPRNSR